MIAALGIHALMLGARKAVPFVAGMAGGGSSLIMAQDAGGSSSLWDTLVVTGVAGVSAATLLFFSAKFIVKLFDQSGNLMEQLMDENQRMRERIQFLEDNQS